MLRDHPRDNHPERPRTPADLLEPIDAGQQQITTGPANAERA
jgi:hypothetical protein